MESAKGSPIFLIGTQRSGTTLLGRMLTAHPDVFIKNEIPVHSVFTEGASREEIEERIDHSVNQRFGKSLSELLKEEGKQIWGVKDPELTRYLDQLKQFLPEARFIIITRDPRAVVSSYIENRWGLGTNAYTGALRWLHEVGKQITFERELPDRVLRLQFEDLVSDQKKSLEKICDFAGIEFAPSMMEYFKQKAFVSRSRTSVNTFKAPDVTILDKWRKKLSRHQVKVIDSVTLSLLPAAGYEPETEPYEIPFWMKFGYRLHQTILGEIQIQYQWRFRRWFRF